MTVTVRTTQTFSREKVDFDENTPAFLSKDGCGSISFILKLHHPHSTISPWGTCKPFSQKICVLSKNPAVPPKEKGGIGGIVYGY